MSGWRFHPIGLIVTGVGEERFLPKLLGALSTSGRCSFKVIRRIGQRSPQGEKKKLEMVGRGGRIPDKDTEEIGLPARRFLLENPLGRVLLVDDVEQDRAPRLAEVFRRYRDVLDALLRDQSQLAAVHFLRNMVEAYYFAHAAAVNAVLPGTLDGDHPEDVEAITHPKNQLKRCAQGFDEVRHGQAIVAALDLEHVLSREETCASLRALVAWCTRAIGEEESERFALDRGVYCWVTGPQPGPTR